MGRGRWRGGNLKGEMGRGGNEMGETGGGGKGEGEKKGQEEDGILQMDMI